MAEEVPPRRVGDILHDHPEFRFDLVGHLRWSHHADWLRERWATALSPPDPLSPQDLLEAIPTLAGRIPAYVGHDGAGSLADLPLVDRDRLRCDIQAFLDPAADRSSLWTTKSSGTTGTALQVFYDEQFYLEQLFLTVPKVLLGAGRAGALSSPVLLVQLTDATEAQERAFADPAGLFGTQFRVCFDPGDDGSIDRALSITTDLRPAVVASRPELFRVLLEHDARNETEALRHVDCLISSGSSMPGTLRDEVSAIFAPVVQLYALSEIGFVAAECPEGRWHAQPSMLVETVSATGRPVPDGEVGEVAISSLANRAMPLVRYRTGDHGRRGRRPCPCGSPGTTLELVGAREVQCFRWASGALFVPTVLYDFFEGLPIQNYQVSQMAPDRLQVVVHPADGDPHPGLLSVVRAGVQSKLPPDVSVETHIGTLPPGRPNERYRVLF